MTPVIERDLAEKLLNRALNNQGDPLGYRSFGGAWNGTDDDVDSTTECDQVNAVDELATNALAGRDGKCAHLLGAVTTDMKMDVVTASLLLHIGIEPAAALAVLEAVLVDGPTTLQIADADGAGDDVWIIKGSNDHWDVMLDEAGHGWWMSYGTITLGHALPDTACIAASGRPLRTLLSHPVLNTFDLTIASADIVDDKISIRVAGYPQAQESDPGPSIVITKSFTNLVADRKQRLRQSACITG